MGSSAQLPPVPPSQLFARHTLQVNHNPAYLNQKLMMAVKVLLTMSVLVMVAPEVQTAVSSYIKEWGDWSSWVVCTGEYCGLGKRSRKRKEILRHNDLGDGPHKPGCTPDNPCDAGDGDCVGDADCRGDLVCGKNCPEFDLRYTAVKTNCCQEPDIKDVLDVVTLRSALDLSVRYRRRPCVF